MSDLTTYPNSGAETVRPASNMAHPATSTVGNKIGRIICNKRLRRYQHIHSLFFSLAGLFGVFGVIYQAFFISPISLLDITIFLVCFVLVTSGVTVGYHRHFTHRSFRAVPVVRATLAILGCMAGQGPIVFWVALHRWHHEFSDREGDPHSPNLFGKSFRQRVRGLFYAYIGWTVQHDVPNANFYARDILNDRLIMSINRLYYIWVLLGLVLPAAVAALVTHTWIGALEGFLWGGLVRMFAGHNVIWWITSFAHIFGTRDLPSKDLSTNNFWIAVPTLGEAWHNNHHCFPTAAILRFRWWEIDISGMVIAALEKAGLVWGVQRPKSEVVESLRLPKQRSRAAS